MPNIIRSAERYLRLLFYVATCLMLTVAITRAPAPLAVVIAVILAGLAALGRYNVPPLLRRGDRTGSLRAEMLSVGAAIALLALSFIMRSTNRPFGAVDLVAIVALAYFGWRIRVVRRHIGNGTLPPVRPSAISELGGSMARAMDLGRTARERREGQHHDNR